MAETGEENGKELFLAVQSGLRSCVIPLSQVVEVMRPAAVCALQDMPPYMDGMAMIRGAPVPVVRLSSLLGHQGAPPPGRLVVVVAGERRVAIGVEKTTGVLSLERSLFQALPPLLRDAFPEFVSYIQVQDREFFLLLQTSRMLPDEVWHSLEVAQA